MGGERGDTEADAGSDAVAQAALTLLGQGQQSQHVAQRGKQIGFEHGAAEMEEPRLERSLKYKNQRHGPATRQPPSQRSRYHRQGDAGEGVWQPDGEGC